MDFEWLKTLGLGSGAMAVLIAVYLMLTFGQQDCVSAEAYKNDKQTINQRIERLEKLFDNRFDRLDQHLENIRILITK